jgi:sugar (pentulose or hexulose) kinase
VNDILLGIDLGTTRLKVSAFSLDGNLHHQSAKRHREHRDDLGAWQAPDDWWLDTAELVRTTVAAAAPCRVAGLSLSGRAGAGIFADAAGSVLVPPWTDARHRTWQRRLREHPAAGAVAPYATALAAKYLWVREQNPELASRIRHAFHAKDFLLYRLTGAHLTDWSSGPDGPHWPLSMLEAFDVDPTLLPAPALPWQLAGHLTTDAAAALGLPAATPVAVGAHDGICANVGVGAARPGDCAITLGTHAVVRQVTASHVAGGNRFYGLPPDRHVIGGNALMGGRAADWFLDLLGIGEAERESAFARMDDAAAALPVGADGVRFLPFLGGQVAPRVRPRARAAFAGLGLQHGAAHAYRAVLEGTAFAVREIFDQVSGWCGEPRRVRITGSGARSPVWRDILAGVLERPIEYSDAAVEGRGAAIFLAVALGMHPDYDTAADAMVPVLGVAEPDSSQADAYRTALADWRRVDGLGLGAG